VRVGEVELDGLADLSRISAATATEVVNGGAGAADLKAQFGGDALERLRRDEQRTGGETVVVEAEDD